MTHKKLNLASYGVLGVALVLLSVFLYWMLWPYKTVDILHVSLVTPGVKAGGVLIIKLDFCNHRDTPRVVAKQLYDSRVISLPEVTAPGGAPRCGSVNTTTPIPTDSLPGKYFMRVNTSLKVNPLRTINVKYQTPEFVVLKGDRADN